MPKGLNRSIARGRPTVTPVVKQNINLTALPISVAGVSGIGWGTIPLRGMPQGNVLFLGLVASLQFFSPSAGITAAWTGNFSIGTAPTADSTLSGAEVDIVASTALTAATAKLSPLVRVTNATQSIIDNTANDLELNLNVLVADAEISADSILQVTGFVSVAYVILGDD